MNNISLYIHIPFCKSRCSYCSFFSTTQSLKSQENYFKALKIELSGYREILKKRIIQTIYFGGGTPSLIQPKLIGKFLKYINSNFDVSRDVETTIECNPESITRQKLQIYKQYGINRISVGLQAFQNKILKFLNRPHTIKQFTAKYKLIEEFGFENTNIDLIFGIPTQTFTDWEQTLIQTIQLNPSHISCYSLETENNSLLAKKIRNKTIRLPSESLNLKMYYFAESKLNKAHYNQYEISNFAKKGFECKHNLSFWRCCDYIGLGAGAHSKIHNQHYQNIANLHHYIKKTKNDECTKTNIVKLSKKDELLESIILGLRLRDGLNLDTFQNKFKKSILTLYKNQITKLSKHKLVEVNHKYLKLTRKGMDLENKVLEEFI